MSRRDEDLVCVGHVLGAQGLKGWIRVYSHTSPRENIVNYSPWWLEREKGYEAFEVEGRKHGKYVLARMQGVEDRDAAEAMIGQRLYIRAGQLPSLEADEYYWSDLIGMTVETLDAEPLGRVSSMLETGADDVMVLEGDRQRLIPFVLDEIVREVDLGNRRLVVDWSPDY